MSSSLRKIVALSSILTVILFIVSFDVLLENQLSHLFRKDAGTASVVTSGSSLIIYDGENGSAPLNTDPNRSCISYAEEGQTAGRNGSRGLILKPDPWHAPNYKINCGAQGRVDFTPYAYLEFYIKGPSNAGDREFNAVSYYGRSNTINIPTYIEGGVIDENWRLVSIPISTLKSSTYDLSSIDDLYFGADASSRTFYIDDIVLRKAKTAAPAPVVSPPPTPVLPPVIKIYDGEASSAPLLSTATRSCLQYASQENNGGRNGGAALKITPDPYHGPNLKINCGGRDRMDWSQYASLEFYFRSVSAVPANLEISVVSYYGKSNPVRIKSYIEQGTIDSQWRLVSIPLSAFRTSYYTLNSVDDIFWGTDPSQGTYYVDDIVIRQRQTSISTVPPATTPPVVVPTQPSPVPVVPQPLVVASTSTPVIPIVPPPHAEPILPSVGVPVVDTIDLDEIDLANKEGQWLYAENKEYISLNFVKAYEVNKATSVSKYSITSSNDPAYSSAKNTVGNIGYRWRAIYIPTIRKSDLKIAYRLFLKLPSPLVNGKTYTVTVGDIGTPTKPFTFTYNDHSFSPNVKINQVGYLPSARKIAYVGQYMGSTGAMPFSISAFEVVNANSGAIVYSGTGALRNANDKYTGQSVYEMDFSGLSAAGSYYVRVPGVGSSYPFRIGTDVYNEIFGTAFRGVYQQRSGTALTLAYTRFTHALSHAEDALVMNHNPIPSWFRSRFDSQGDTGRKDAQGQRMYYPTSLSGQFINTTKGHYDAGDYGKYTVSGALFVGNILAAYDAFPRKLMKDDMNIPESGNGIPDLLDETKWELDWLENMQDPNDGGVFCIVKPDGAVEFYEDRSLGVPSPSKRLLYPKDTTCTAAFAAALAKAARSPVIKKYYAPEVSARYLSKAQKAWGFLEKNEGYLAWHHYGAKDDDYSSDKSLDDRVWAAIELYGATGLKVYSDYFSANAKPDYVHWGWQALFESSGQAMYACAFMNRPGFDTALKAQCVNAVVTAGNNHVVDSNARAYHASISASPLDYGYFSYIFPQERIIALLMANALQPSSALTQAALYNWDYILGANPTGYSMITGIGSRRFRDVVSVQSVYDGIVSPVPGIPIGISSGIGHLAEYGSAKNAQSPTKYPALLQSYDGWNLAAEFTTPEIAENLISSAYFATEGETKNIRPSSIDVTATPTYGTVPLTVQFRATATDPDGTIVKYRWDFDDEGFSNKQNPIHTFIDPYKVYKVVVTVTDNDGAETYKEIRIQTQPAVSKFGGTSYVTDADTLALFNFDSSTQDNIGKQLNFTLSNKAKLSSNNLLWMKNPAGQALEFTSAYDTASVDLPSTTASLQTLAVEGKIYIDTHAAFDTTNAELFVLKQGERKAFGLFDKKYVEGTFIKSSAGYATTEQATLLNKDQIAGKLKTKTWHLFKLVISGGNASVYIDNEKVGETSIDPQFSASAPITLVLGGFKGFIDEIRISNTNR